MQSDGGGLKANIALGNALIKGIIQLQFLVCIDKVNFRYYIINI
jgi:hypothetical protein